jgi:hypothetical protein
MLRKARGLRKAGVNFTVFADRIRHAACNLLFSLPG